MTVPAKMENIDSATPTESEEELTPEQAAALEKKQAARAKKRRQREKMAKMRTEWREDEKEDRWWKKERLRWAKWDRDQLEREERMKQFEEYWVRRKQDDKGCWREKNMANAVDKMSRIGYKGKHGDFDMPEEDKIDMHGLYMQGTYGDIDTVRPGPDQEIRRRQWDSWNSRKGMNREEAQQAFISRANRLLTLYGWNPPPGWK